MSAVESHLQSLPIVTQVTTGGTKRTSITTKLLSARSICTLRSLFAVSVVIGRIRATCWFVSGLQAAVVVPKSQVQLLLSCGSRDILNSCLGLLKLTDGAFAAQGDTIEGVARGIAAAQREPHES